MSAPDVPAERGASGTMNRRRQRLAATALSFAAALVGASCSAPGSLESAAGGSTIGARMPDGKLWMTENVGVAAADSYCYADRESNCRRYGRLYAWASAQQACLAFGDGWRLPTDGDWRELARHFGGVFDDAQDRGNAAYHALLRGGRSGLGAVLGGGRTVDGQYDDLDAHGFYWTASEDAPDTALFYNFGRGSTALYRQTDGEKPMALSVRCIQ
jgi:uncharacterized protein (TIGR02145 family)